MIGSWYWPVRLCGCGALHFLMGSSEHAAGVVDPIGGILILWRDLTDGEPSRIDNWAPFLTIASVLRLLAVSLILRVGPTRRGYDGF